MEEYDILDVQRASIRLQIAPILANILLLSFLYDILCNLAAYL